MPSITIVPSKVLLVSAIEVRLFLFITEMVSISW